MCVFVPFSVGSGCSNATCAATCQSAACDGSGACQCGAPAIADFTACGGTSTCAQCTSPVCLSGQCACLVLGSNIGAACTNTTLGECHSTAKCQADGSCLVLHDTNGIPCGNASTCQQCLAASCTNGECKCAPDVNALHQPCNSTQTAVCLSTAVCNVDGSCAPVPDAVNTSCPLANPQACESAVGACDGLGGCNVPTFLDVGAPCNVNGGPLPCVQCASSVCGADHTCACRPDATQQQCTNAACDGVCGVPACNATSGNCDCVPQTGASCDRLLKCGACEVATCNAAGNCECALATNGTACVFTAGDSQCASSSGTCNSTGVCVPTAYVARNVPCNTTICNGDAQCLTPQCDGFGTCACFASFATTCTSAQCDPVCGTPRCTQDGLCACAANAGTVCYSRTCATCEYAVCGFDAQCSVCFTTQSGTQCTLNTTTPCMASVGTCNGQFPPVCTVTALANDTVCDAGLACGPCADSLCEAGKCGCQQRAVNATCTPNGACAACEVPQCTADGACVCAPVDDGTTCGTTTNGACTCQAHACVCPQCDSSLHCDDNNTCTHDLCVAGHCQFTADAALNCTSAACDTLCGAPTCNGVSGACECVAQPNASCS